MRKERIITNRASRRRMFKRSGKKMLAAALSAAMLTLGIYPAGFPVKVSADEAVTQAVDAVTYKAKVDISKLTPENGKIIYRIEEDGDYYFTGSNEVKNGEESSYVPTSIVVDKGVKANLYLDGLNIRNDDGAVPDTCSGEVNYIEGTDPITISEYAQVSMHVINKSELDVVENASAVAVRKNASLTLEDGADLDIRMYEVATGIDVAGTFIMNGGILNITESGWFSVGIGVSDPYGEGDYSQSNIIINDGTINCRLSFSPVIGVYAGYYLDDENEDDKKYEFGTIQIHGGQINGETDTETTMIGAKDCSYLYSECKGIVIDGGTLDLRQSTFFGNPKEEYIYAGKDATEDAVILAGGTIGNSHNDRGKIPSAGAKDCLNGNEVSGKALFLPDKADCKVIDMTAYDTDGTSYSYGSYGMKTDAAGKLYTYLADNRTNVQVALSDRSIMEGTVSGDAAQLALSEDKSNVPVFEKGYYRVFAGEESAIDIPKTGADCKITYSYAAKTAADAAPQDDAKWTKLNSLSDVKSLKAGSYWIKAAASDAEADGVNYKAADSVILVDVKTCRTHVCDAWDVCKEDDIVEAAVCSVCGETVYRAHDYSDKKGICKICHYACKHPSYSCSNPTREGHEMQCNLCGLTEMTAHNWLGKTVAIEEQDNKKWFEYDEKTGRWISNSASCNETTAKTSWTFELEEAGAVSFEWGVSSEEGYDLLYVELEDSTGEAVTVLSSQSGTGPSGGYITGNAATAVLPAGKHTLTAYYQKDSSSSEGLDQAYIKFADDFEYSDVVYGEEVIPVFTRDADRARWSRTGYTDECYDGIYLTVTCENRCRLPFRLGFPEHGYIGFDLDRGRKFYEMGDPDIVWVDFGKGQNEMNVYWGIYGDEEEAEEVASQDAVSIEFLADSSHICVDCGYIGEHEYSGDCDKSCNICDEKRDIQGEHQFGADGRADKCDNCGILNVAALTVDADKLQMTYTGQKQYPEVVLKDSQGNIVSPDAYSIEAVSESAVSTEEGYTFTVSGNGVDAVGSQTGKWSISYLSTDAAAAAEGTKKSDNGWLASDVKIKAPAGYLIADSNEADAEWAEYLAHKGDKNPLVVSEDGSTELTYYLKDVKNGGITDAKSIIIRKDTAAPVLEVKTSSGEAAGLAVTDDSVRVTFYAEDTVSGIDTVKYVLDDKGEVSAASGDSLLVTEAGQHVLIVTAIDKAGNTSFEQIEFTISEKKQDNPGGSDNPGGNDNPGDNDNPGGSDKTGFKAGDADCNNKVDLNDAKIVLKLSLGISAEVTEQGKLNADYDKSGNIDLNDAKYTLKEALGIKVVLK